MNMSAEVLARRENGMHPLELLLHHYRACNLCEAICGLDVVLRGDAIESIRGDADDPFSRGHICPKAVALQDVHADPDRLRQPIRRTTHGWERITWKGAFDETASRIQSIQRRYGDDAIAVYLGNPSVHNYGTLLFAPPLLKALHTRNRFSATSLDQLPHHIVARLLFGHQLLLPVPDVDRTGFFVIMGGNPLVSNGSMMTVPDIRKRLEAIRQRGGKVIVIDPRRTETAEFADQHLFIRPGSDALLMLAVLNVVFAEALVRPGRLSAFLDGVEEMQTIAEPFTPERAAKRTGIAADSIRELARAFAGAQHAVWYGRVGVSTQEFGTLTQWLIAVVNILTGNLDRLGGAMFTRPAVDLLAPRRVNPGTMGRWRSRVRQLPEFAGELPTVTLAEEILTPGKGQIRGLLTIAGNPVLSSPNGRQLEKALAQLEFMASIDIYRNETTRHAHIILPPTGALEHEHYDVIFHLLAIRNTARFSPALFRPPQDTRHDWEILLELHTRLLARGGPISRAKAWLRRAVLRRLGPQGLLDLGLRFGPYGSGWKLWKRGLTVRRLKQFPHGIDLGPLEACLPGRLQTAAKRIHLVPEFLRADMDRLRLRHDRLEREAAVGTVPTGKDGGTPAVKTELLLIGRRQVRSNNSWMHNSERLVKGKERCTLLIHPTDAVQFEIANGQRIRLVSRVGTIEAIAEVSDEIMPGVVSLPHGWGHTREDTQIQTAQRHPGVSINDVCDELAIDAVSGNAAFSGTPVRIEPIVPAGAR
jgi:anaerobic selenocysteine-containing dehydrogenase